jgi:hypothetical protein
VVAAAFSTPAPPPPDAGRDRARRWLAPIGGGVEEIRPPEPTVSRAEQVRALGFDPVHLTPEEQVEVLEMHLLCPDEALSV